MTAMMVSD